MSEGFTIQGDPEVITALASHLVAAFEEFADHMAPLSPEGLSFVDAFLGVHNFHKQVILDLERHAINEGKTMPVLLRVLAISTLARAFQEAPLPQPQPPNPSDEGDRRR